MQFGLRGVITTSEPCGQEITEQRVEAIPRLAIIGFNAKDQQVFLVQPLEHRLC
ncbi:hypothetical protein D3C85_1177140 [compost metagenome]